jgi:hypothetical protein
MEGKKLLIGLLMGILFLQSSSVHAQKKKLSLKDSLDQAFDLSDYIIDAKGFVPVPYFTTEPALGGFGIAIIPVFIKKNPPYIDSVKGTIRRTPVAPDITGGILVYTVNNTWVTAAFRSGTLIKQRIKYTLGTAYANINISFFRDFNQTGEKEYEVNIKGLPIYLQATKRLGQSYWYLGFKYLFLKAESKYVGNKLLDSLGKSFEMSSTVSHLGAILELDNRDNIFTPDKGVKLHGDAIRSDDAIGSDFDYWKFNYYLYSYFKLSRKLIGGLRLDGQQITGNPPFYMLPYLDMRGLPAVRYQGKADILTELEFRWDFYRRWSVMFFSGTGKAFDDWNQFGSADWITTFGTGARYLLARKFKLRVGIDVAKGPETWAYYIVFGSNWRK